MGEYRHNCKVIAKGRGPSPLNWVECGLFSYDDIHAGESRPGQGDLREEVLLRDGPICAWCKKACNLWEVQVDHIKPSARFKRPQDADRLENLQVLCTEHHRAKTKTDLKVLSRVRSKPHARF